MEPIQNNNPPSTPNDLPALQSQTAAGPNPVNFPNGITEDSIKAYCRTRNKSFDGWYKQFIDRMADFHKIFRNFSVGVQKGSRPVPLPIGYGIIESINARLSAAVLNRPKVVDAVSEFVSLDNTNQKKIEDFINQKVLDVSRQPEKGKSALKGCIIESVMFWRCYWKTKETQTTRPIYQPDPSFIPNPADPMAQPEQIYVGEETYSESYGCWDWEYKNPANMGWEPHCTTKIQDSPWVRERSKMSYNDLLKWQQEGRISGVERLKTIVPKGVGGALKEDWEAQLKRADGDMNWNFSYADMKEYAIEEWFADVTYQDGEEVKTLKAHWFVAEADFVVMFEENVLIPKRIPYGSCPFAIDPHGIIGLSAVETIKNVQGQIDMFAAKQSDLVDRATNPLILYDDSSGLTGRTTFMRMFGMQPVQNVNGLKEFPINVTSMQVVQEYINFLIGLMREASGANEQFQGTEGADTATEFAGLQAAAGTRFADVADTINQAFMEQLANECYYFYKQFGEDGKMVFHDTTADGMAQALTRADFQGQYSFQAISSTTESYKAKQVMDDTQFLAEISKIPPEMMGGKRYNFEKHITEISLPLRGQRNSKDSFIDVMPMMPSMGGNLVPMPQTTDAPLPIEGAM